MHYRLCIFSLLLTTLVNSQSARHLAPVLNTRITPVKSHSAPASEQVGFVSTNIRYQQGSQPQVLSQKQVTLQAWRGEKVHTQLALWSNEDVATASVFISDLSAKDGHVIAKTNVTTGYAGYVLTDEFKDGCGHRRPQDFDSSFVADLIRADLDNVALKKNTVQPVWISVQVPANTPPGIYRGTVTVKTNRNHTLPFTVKVLNKTLPPPAQWSFALDLWQHPAAVARVHKVPLWSDAHFTLLKSYYTMLARAGQKSITASIVNEPWGHQTYDDFPSLVKWTKKMNGEWHYDYSLFDRYISFVMQCGINQRINCYSMVPWKVAFSYYDERLGKDTVFTGDIGTPAYNAFWQTMITDFTAHLKQKGWFNITAIAMDERPLAAMQAVIALLKTVDKGWKIALAGNYHPEIENDVFDYCIASRLQFPADVLQRRKKEGKLSTWYTSCTEAYPNLFTFSPPAEPVWMGWYTAAKNMDGYLRWAYNSWPKNPLLDSRFTSWPAGDTYQVYPGPATSIRFEKLIEGIQDFEKIQVVRAEYKRKGNKKKQDELEQVLAAFNMQALERQTAEKMVEKAKALLNQ